MRSSLVVAIAALALIGLFSQGLATDTTSKARFIGAISVPKTVPENGGFSGLSLDETGKRFLTITDQGTFFSGRLERKNGAIEKIILERRRPLLSPQGKTLTKPQRDSEGLAVRADGRIYVSFEGIARVWTYRDVASEAAWIPRHAHFKKLPLNGALEALAIAPDGSLFSLVEGTSRYRKPHPVYRYGPQGWKIFSTIERRGRFLPVGADFGPDGKFYLLERNFGPLSGFQTRIRRFDVVGDQFEAEEVVLESAFGEHGNLEGLSVWRDEWGQIRLTMIADNNFKFFLKSEIVEYSLKE